MSVPEKKTGNTIIFSPRGQTRNTSNTSNKVSNRVLDASGTNGMDVNNTTDSVATTPRLFFRTPPAIGMNQYNNTRPNLIQPNRFQSRFSVDYGKDNNQIRNSTASSSSSKPTPRTSSATASTNVQISEPIYQRRTVITSNSKPIPALRKLPMPGRSDSVPMSQSARLPKDDSTEMVLQKQSVEILSRNVQNIQENGEYSGSRISSYSPGSPSKSTQGSYVVGPGSPAATPKASSSADIKTKFESDSDMKIAIQLCEQLMAYCDRNQTSPRALFLSFTINRNECLSKEELRNHVTKILPNVPVSNIDIFCDACMNTCIIHKRKCIKVLTFEEAVSRGHNIGLRNSVHAAELGLKLFSSFLRSADDVNASALHHQNSIPDSMQPTSPYLTSRLTATGLYESRFFRKRLPSVSVLLPVTDGNKMEFDSVSPEMCSFIALGGDPKSGVLRKRSFTDSVKKQCKRGGWNIPLELIEERWIKVDPQGVDFVSFQDYCNIFLVGNRTNKTNGQYLGSGKVGLDNLGNTCFLNSSIQCLRSCRDFINLLTDEEFVNKSINTESSLGSQGEISIALAQLIIRMELLDGTAESPVHFRQMIQKHGANYAGSRQHDAQEFIGFLLDMLHEDFNRVTQKPYIEGKDITEQIVAQKGYERLAAEQWYHYLLRDKSIIIDSFQGQTRSTIRCTRCNYSLTKFESFMFLPLPVISSSGVQLKTLDECLLEFCEPEQLRGDNQWYCQECRMHVDAEKIMNLWKLPKYLIISLKRFQMSFSSGLRALGNKFLGGKTQMQKVNHQVNVPLVLCMQKHIPPESPQRTPPSFSLISMIRHFGSPTYGHYTTCAKHPDGTWQFYDDSLVSEVSEDEIKNRTSNAYVYFFERDSMSVELSEILENKDLSPRQTVNEPSQWPHLSHNRWSFLEENNNEQKGMEISD